MLGRYAAVVKKVGIALMVEGAEEGKDTQKKHRLFSA